MKSTILLLIIAIVGFCGRPVFAQPSDVPSAESPRVAVPDASASQQALKTVKDLFQSEYAKAKLATEKRLLATKLLQVANETSDDPASRYVLLLESQRLATETGDIVLTLQVVDAVVNGYLVDPIPTKAKALSSVNEKLLPVEARKAVSEAALAVVTEAIAADQYDAAKQIGNTALAAARQAKDIDLVKRVAAVQATLDETAKAYLQAKAAFAILKEKSTDPQANTTAGSFLCFDKQDWQTGLPMLAHSSDAELQALAREEISPNPAALTLGDGWWRVAESKKGRTADNVKTHAVEWYEKALPEATGLVKAKIEKRLKEVGDLASATDDRSWLVIFRSDDPAIWNSDVKEGPNKLAMSLSKTPDDIAWLKIAISKNDYVIIPMTKDRLQAHNDKDRFNWNGSNLNRWNARALGIYDKQMGHRNKGEIEIHTGMSLAEKNRGWGFGPRGFIGDKQGYSWGGEEIEKTAFEVSVKADKLSSKEQKHLLAEEPKKPNESK